MLQIALCIGFVALAVLRSKKEIFRNLKMPVKRYGYELY